MKRLLFLLLISFSCNSTVSKEEKLPKTALIVGYKVEANQVLYQFYEKFGFADVCVHTRSYFKIDDFTTFDEWTKLPMTKVDRLKLNSMSNKVDSLKENESDFDVVYRYKDVFSDISLTSLEFIKDTVFESKIELTEGYYRIDKKTLRIYNNKNKTMYYEHHSCDD